MKYIFTNRVKKTLPKASRSLTFSTSTFIAYSHETASDKTNFITAHQQRRKKEIKYLMYFTFATNFTLSRDNFCWHSESINYSTELQEGEIQN